MERAKLPVVFYSFYHIAKEERLSCPKGRAIYAVNRHMNGWPTIHGLEKMDDLELLRRTKLETAKKWLKHWENGGSLKSSRSVSAEKLDRYIRSKRLRDARKSQ
jgi:hypothetical protein